MWWCEVGTIWGRWPILGRKSLYDHPRTLFTGGREAVDACQTARTDCGRSLCLTAKPPNPWLSSRLLLADGTNYRAYERTCRSRVTKRALRFMGRDGDKTLRPQGLRGSSIVHGLLVKPRRKMPSSITLGKWTFGRLPCKGKPLDPTLPTLPTLSTL